MTSFCRPATAIEPSSCGKGRYTNHHTTAPAAMTTMATVQRRKRRMDRKLAPSGKGETVSVAEGLAMVRAVEDRQDALRNSGRAGTTSLRGAWENPRGCADSAL